MNQRLFGVIAGIAMATTLGMAQTAPPTPEQAAANVVARLTRLLDLKSSQQNQATVIFTTEETALGTVRTAMQSARFALKTAVMGNNAAGISTQAAAIGALTAQEVQARGTADAALYAILTADQQAKYEAIGPRLGGFGASRPGGTH